jgi:hypothetical protein
MEPPSSDFVRGGKWKEIERDISITGEEDAHRLLTMQEEDSGGDGDEVVGREEEEEEEFYKYGDDDEGEEGDSGEGARCVHVNDRAANAAAGFATNMTSTTKYTWWNFPFKNLYEQVHAHAHAHAHAHTHNYSCHQAGWHDRFPLSAHACPIPPLQLPPPKFRRVANSYFLLVMIIQCTGLSCLFLFSARLARVSRPS